MAASIFYLVAFVAIIFWLIQVVDLLMRDGRDFESRTHKLTWFLVLITGSVVGAIWYFSWRRRIVTIDAQADRP